MRVTRSWVEKLRSRLFLRSLLRTPTGLQGLNVKRSCSHRRRWQESHRISGRYSDSRTRYSNVPVERGVVEDVRRRRSIVLRLERQPQAASRHRAVFNNPRRAPDTRARHALFSAVRSKFEVLGTRRGITLPTDLEHNRIAFKHAVVGQRDITALGHSFE